MDLGFVITAAPPCRSTASKPDTAVGAYLVYLADKQNHFTIVAHLGGTAASLDGKMSPATLMLSHVYIIRYFQATVMLGVDV